MKLVVFDEKAAKDGGMLEAYRHWFSAKMYNIAKPVLATGDKTNHTGLAYFQVEGQKYLLDKKYFKPYTLEGKCVEDYL